jgi:hypothetical protein
MEGGQLLDISGRCRREESGKMTLVIPAHHWPLNCEHLKCAGLFPQRDEILQQPQAHRLAFLRVKLCRIDVPAPDG